MNKKIFFIINGLGYGGAETHLLKLSAALLLTNDFSLPVSYMPDQYRCCLAIH